MNTRYIHCLVGRGDVKVNEIGNDVVGKMGMGIKSGCGNGMA